MKSLFFVQTTLLNKVHTSLAFVVKQSTALNWFHSCCKLQVYVLKQIHVQMSYEKDYKSAC